MKILFLTQTIEKGPASRVRGYEVAKHLSLQGCETVVSPGIGATAYNWVYSSSNSFIKLPFYFKALIKRLLNLLSYKKFDLVVIQKEIFPHFYPLIESCLKLLKIPYVFDFDDALFGRPNKPNWIPSILKKASGVIAGNDFLANYAKRFNSNTIVIPSSIDLEQFSIKQQFGKEGKISLGWMGSRSSWEHLESIHLPIEKLLNSHPFLQLILIGEQLPLKWKPLADSGRVLFYQWDAKCEDELLSLIDIGLAPLKENIWSEGKCGYKILQYMAKGLPVIASPIGVQKGMIEDGVNGCLAETLEEWEKKGEWLCAHQEKWDMMGQKSRNRVENDFSIQSQIPKLKQFFSSIIEK